MDRANLAELRAPAVTGRYRRGSRCSSNSRPKRRSSEVPDPYYGGVESFERVLDLCEVAARRTAGAASSGA